MANDALRRLRLAREWTQADVAERVCAHVSATTGRVPAFDSLTISKLERGLITWPNREYRDALQAVFEVPDSTALGFYPKRTRRDARGVEETQRRDFLALAAVALPDVLPRRLGRCQVK